MRKGVKDFDNAPDVKELERFKDFITDLDSMISAIKSGEKPSIKRIKVPFLLKIIPSFPRTKSKSDFGRQKVNPDLCTECKVCMKGCPYGAITMNPKPVFDHTKCFGCWYCYNHCKDKAIYTDKFKGEYQYPKPGKELVEKLG